MSYGKMTQTLTILSNVNEKKPSALQKMRRITFSVMSILVNFQTYSLLKADYTATSFFFLRFPEFRKKLIYKLNEFSYIA